MTTHLTDSKILRSFISFMLAWPDWLCTVQERPDPSKHVVARVYYPANPEGKLRSRRPYLPNSIYARGLAMYALSIALKEQKWYAATVRKWLVCSGKV